MQDVAFKNLKN